MSHSKKRALRFLAGLRKCVFGSTVGPCSESYVLDRPEANNLNR